MIQKSNWLSGLNYLVEQEPVKYAIMLRLSPIPSVLKNYSLALLPIRLKEVVIATIVQGSFSSFIQASLSAGITDLVQFITKKDAQGNPVVFDNSIFYSLLPLVLGLSVTFWINRKVKQIIELEKKKIEKKDQ